jgi:predicted aspartyl protease
MEHTRRAATGALLVAAAAGVAALIPHQAHAAPTADAATPGAKPPPPTSGALAAPPPTTPADDASIGAGKDAFQHLTAPVMLNGQGPFPFMVDTGANISCVSRQLAQALGAPILAPRPMHTMVGVGDHPVTLIEELRIGELKRREVTMLAVALEEAKLAGVLGVDWLKDQRMTMDFVDNSLQFSASHHDWSRLGRVIVPARRRFGQLTIVDAELGSERISAMIDSGSEASLCNTALLRRVEPRGRRGGKRQVIPMLSVLGEPFVGDVVYLPFLKLGGLELGDVPVVYADTHAFEIWGLTDTPAVLLGMDLLRQFRAVSLDFGRAEVRFDLANA